MTMLGVRGAIQPLVNNLFAIPGYNFGFGAACFSGNQWSLKPLQKSEDIEPNRTFADQVDEALHGLGVVRAFAPNPVPSNAKIIKPSQLQRILPLGRVSLCRNQDWPGDGTYLWLPGEAGVFSAGGCGVLVVSHGKTLVFAHASRESLVDRQWVLTGGRERSREFDVVDNALDALDIPASEMANVWAWLLYFIHPGDFDHHFDNRLHGEYNRAAGKLLPQEFPDCAWVKKGTVLIGLPHIATLQLMRRGVPVTHINRDHQYLANELPHTRNGDNKSRYLVTIVRY